MSKVLIHTADDREKGSLPVFQEIERRFEEARRRAYGLYEQRGGGDGRDWEDWLQAERELLGDAGVTFEEKAGQTELIVTMEGFGPKDIEVTATPTEFAIHARREEQDTVREVLRRIELSKPVRPDQVSAKFEKGVLRIIAPTAERATSAGGPSVTVAVA